MQRLIDKSLENWKNAKAYKPLVLRGARQVGKTHAVRRLGRTFEHFVEVNLEQLVEARSLFEGSLDAALLVRQLQLVTGKSIIPGKTLLFIDEIQIVPRAITALRYFYEEIPSLHVIAAGSLINFAIEQVGIPVGRVSFLYMYPLSFLEFVLAIDGAPLADALRHYDIHQPFPEAIHAKVLRLLGEYMAIGGLPEVVASWRDHQDLTRCQHQHHDLLSGYQQDFHQYAQKTQLKYLAALFDQCPRLMGQAFRYKQVSTTYRRRELLPCLNLLVKAGIIYRVQYTAGNGLPLGGEVNFEKFKLLFLDVALAQTALDLDRKNWILHPTQMLINKGAITEAFVGQELLAYSDSRSLAKLYYWHRESRNSSAEVDYLTPINHQVIPIEVKAGQTAHLKSLHAYLNQRPQSPYGICFSPKNAQQHHNIHRYPLYAVFAAIQHTTQ